MKTAEQWLNEVGETVATSMFSQKKPPGNEVEKLIRRIQADALRYASDKCWHGRDHIGQACDDVIREEYHDFGLYAEKVVPALISEVEVLRKKIHELADLCLSESIALRAKLEKAKKALEWSLERLVDCKNCCGYGGVEIEAIEERQAALAELEDKKEPWQP